MLPAAPLGLDKAAEAEQAPQSVRGRIGGGWGVLVRAAVQPAATAPTPKDEGRRECAERGGSGAL